MIINDKKEYKKEICGTCKEKNNCYVNGIKNGMTDENKIDICYKQYKEELKKRGAKNDK
jgi:SRSO17 transposase